MYQMICPALEDFQAMECKLLPHLTANPTTFDGGSWNI